MLTLFTKFRMSSEIWRFSSSKVRALMESWRVFATKVSPLINTRSWVASSVVLMMKKIDSVSNKEGRKGRKKGPTC